MRWPWKREKRENYTDALMADAMRRAEGPPVKTADLAVAGAAARAYATALSLAVVQPESSMVARLLDAQARAFIGVQLVLTGNAILALESGDGGLAAIPVYGLADGGNHDPATWLYTVTFSGPGTSDSRRRRGSGLLHFRLEAEPLRPWAGVSPLARAGVDGAALAALTGQLRDSGNAPHGHLLSTGQFEDEDARKAFEGDIKTLRGNVAVVDRGDYNEAGGAGLTSFGLMAQKLDQGLVLMARNLADGVAAAAGIPPALLSASVSGGTSSREAWRQFGVYMHGVGEVLAAEIAAKLDESVSFDFSELASHDIRARSTAYKALVDAGVPGPDAARLAGLDAAKE